MFVRSFAEAVPSARMRLFAVIQFIRKPAEALPPVGAEPRQLRGLVSGGSLRVGSSWVSDGCWPKVQCNRATCCATFGSGARVRAPPKEGISATQRPAKRSVVRPPRLTRGSVLYGRLHGRVSPGSVRLYVLCRWWPKDLCRRPNRRKLAHRWECAEGSAYAEGGPTWRITVTSATPVTALTVASWGQSVAAPSCTKEESRSVKSEQAAEQEISLGAMRGDP